VRGWWKCPSGRASDVRWASLTFAARGFLATLEDAADGAASVPVVGSVDHLCAVLGGHHGASVARSLFDEVVKSGLVEVLDAPARVAFVAPPFAEMQFHSPPVPPDLSATPPEPGAARKITRQDRHSFNRRVRAWRDVPPGVTLEEWLRTPEGVAWSRRSATVGASQPATLATPATVAHATLATVSATPCDALPSRTLPSEKEREDRENAASDARDAGAKGVADPRPATVGASQPATLATPATVAHATLATVRCDTVEHLTTREVTAGAALMALRGTAQLRLTLTTQQELDLDRVLADVAARGQGWTAAGVARLAEHLRAQHVSTGRDGRPWVPSASSLRGDGSWSRLLALYDEADGCQRCAEERDARRSQTVATKAPIKPSGPPTPESIDAMRRLRAELAARTAPPLTTETAANG
jgi:hypothetical protein